MRRVYAGRAREAAIKATGGGALNRALGATYRARWMANATLANVTGAPTLHRVAKTYGIMRATRIAPGELGVGTALAGFSRSQVGRAGLAAVAVGAAGYGLYKLGHAAVRAGRRRRDAMEAGILAELEEMGLTPERQTAWTRAVHARYPGGIYVSTHKGTYVSKPMAGGKVISRPLTGDYLAQHGLQHGRGGRFARR